jgi:hypothetical protein
VRRRGFYSFFLAMNVFINVHHDFMGDVLLRLHSLPFAPKHFEALSAHALSASKLYTSYPILLGCPVVSRILNHNSPPGLIL